MLDAAELVRGSLPNRYCDPEIAADLFEEVIDEFLLCDDMGMNVLAIEHHAGINSLLGANPMLVGILARQTKKVRILSLGTLVSLRPDPVRVAEEYATADVISRGRLDIGFVKSGGTEMPSANVNPVRNEERYWEAIDLITKALTSHDGPFSWEGKHYTHRHVNIWPGPYQRPHPPLWSATGDPKSAAEVGRRGMRHVLVLRGVEGTQAGLSGAPPGAARRRIAAGHDRQFRLCRLCLCRRHRGGGPAGRQQIAVVSQHEPQIGAAAFALHAGQRAARGAPQIYRDAPRPNGANGGGAEPDQRREGRRGLGQQNARRLMSLGGRGGDGDGHPVRRQPRQRLPPDHGFPRQGRRLQPPRA